MRKRDETDGAILGRRQWSEQVGTVELLLNFFSKRIEPLTDILWRQLLRLPRLRLLTLLTHDDNVRLLA